MNLSLVTDRDAVQNWMAEKPTAIYKLKLSSGNRRGRPGLGAWTVIGSAAEIPSGIRYRLERSLSESDTQSILVEIAEAPKDERTDMQPPVVHTAELMTQARTELESEFQNLTRSALTLSAASQNVSQAAAMASEAVCKALQMQERAQAQVAEATVGNAQAAFYQTLTYSIESLTGLAKVYLAKDLPEEEKAAVSDYAKMAANLRRHGLNIKDINPSDFASFQALQKIPQVRALLQDMAKRNIQEVMSGAMDVGDELTAEDKK